MKFNYFSFSNFKGIELAKLDLNKSPSGNVYALVGLNESGKTTILEAMNYFIFKQESLKSLELDNYEVEDIHNLIPINKRDNFNGRITIEASLIYDEDDIQAITKEFKKHLIYNVNIPAGVIFTQHYHFHNSVHISGKNESLWNTGFTYESGKAKNVKKLSNEKALLVNELIKKRMPSILYFPNFLFEFPAKIYLEDTTEDSKYKFYRKIIQDVLDSLNNNTNLNEHLINRINSNDEKDKRNLNSLIGKMQKKLTDVIFEKWNQIFSKRIYKTEIILIANKDEQGPFIEFNIKDDVDTYRLSERSLGFRWFFVYILLTQFRSYRKEQNNAIFLFDEPASNLHPSAQIELLKSFEKLPNVIYTTHSHYLINPKWLENTFVVRNEAIDYDNEVEYNSKNTNIKITRYREFAANHPNQSSYYQPILEMLDYRPSNLDLVPNVILVEGKNDYYTLMYMTQIVLKTTNSIHIMPGVGSGNLNTIISLYLGWASNFILILDADKEGKKQKDRYITEYGSVVQNAIFTFADIDSSFDGAEMESLFSNADRQLIQNEVYPGQIFAKRLFNLSIQELYITKKKVSLSEVTVSNFSLLIKFLLDRLCSI